MLFKTPSFIISEKMYHMTIKNQLLLKSGLPDEGRSGIINAPMRNIAK